MILGEDSQKMSKSRGNTVDPNVLILETGADSIRLYEMFIGDFEKTATWNTAGIKGCKRFLDRTWALADILADGDEYSEKLAGSMHRTIKKVSEDIEQLKFNTAIAAMMTLINEISAAGEINKAELKTFLILLSPFAPHLASEMFEAQGFGLVHEQQWPDFDAELCIFDEIEIVLQVNGKIKDRIMIESGADKNAMLSAAKANQAVSAAILGKEIVKEIVVTDKLVNIVVK
jgi:leucyl-tRNA synthetase